MKFNSKQIFLLGLVLILSVGCAPSIKKVGQVNMISQRNIDSNGQYKRIGSYIGLSKREMRKKKSESIEDALDVTVKSVPGGEFLMNAKIFMIGGKYFAVEGDVWGVETQEFRGFVVGNRVQWRSKLSRRTGTIVSLVDDVDCMVKLDGKDERVRVAYEKIVRI